MLLMTAGIQSISDSRREGLGGNRGWTTAFIHRDPQYINANLSHDIVRTAQTSDPADSYMERALG